MKKILLSLALVIGFAQLAFSQGVITGVIKNAQGEPLIGATAGVRAATNYTVADEQGRFSLEIKTEPPFTIEFSSVGYDPKELGIQAWPDSVLTVILASNNLLDEVLVTSRRRKEVAQEVPIPITVVTGALVQDAGAFNVNRLKEMVPTVQLYSSNPRNTTLNIRGLGSTFGLTNDGIDPGVGFYVDGVYFVRPAATTLDFIDIEQIEVLRGPQGTLFGKNTTAGAFNVTTRKPSFTRGANLELSTGNYGFIQGKASVTGPLGKKFAGRLSFSGTHRNGLLENVATGEKVNSLSNLGVRAQLLYQPSDRVRITLAGDATRQRPNGYAQVFAGVAPTLRPAYRQFEQIIKDLEYNLPSRNPFDRVIDHDTPWRSDQDLGGVSLNVDLDLGKNSTLTATSAYRYWIWGPSNDRDFTGLEALALSQATSKHWNWSQEVRYAGRFSNRFSGTFGLFAFYQKLDPDPVQIEESGKYQWRFSQNSTSPLWQTPGLLDGYGIKTYPRFENFSGAVFGQLDWKITENLHLLPGLRYNYDEKSVDFRREVYGGLETTDKALLAIKNAVYSNQSFQADIDDTNLSGQLTLNFKANRRLNAFATFSTGFKPVGLNLGGLPTANGAPLVELAVVKPESVRHYELGIKTTPAPNATLNLTVYNTDIEDYQTLVQVPDLSVNRGYLANAEQVRVRGAELDGNVRLGEFLSLYGALTYTEGIYVSFKNAPPPLEETGGASFKDISGGNLPGISKWAGSLGGELFREGKFFGSDGKYFLAFDSYYRSSFSSSPSPSKYLVVDGYALVNARLGFRATEGVSVFLWARNLLDQDYFEQLLPGAGNIGHYAGVLGDPRTYGVTLRYTL